MSETVIIDRWVPGIPKGTPRHRTRRVVRRDGSVGTQVYPGGSADDWRAILVSELGAAPAPVEGPVAVVLEFSLPRPKSLMRARSPDWALAHAKKPDIDNLVKLVCDVLTQRGYWRDDCQVAELTASKAYPVLGGSPGVHVTVSRL